RYEGQAGRRALLDQPEHGVPVEVVGHEVREGVESAFPYRLEGDSAWQPTLSDALGHPGQHVASVDVVLQDPVPHRPEHGVTTTALARPVRKGEERIACQHGDPTMMDLVRGHRRP